MGRMNELASLLGRVSSHAPFRKYLMASYSKATKEAYRGDVAHFKKWGGRIPSTELQLARYLAAYAGKLAYATLSRRITAIHREHVARGLRSPARAELVRATLRGIARTFTAKQRQVKPLLVEHLARMLPKMRGLQGARDKALLLVGFFGGFRRSELEALTSADVEISRWGVAIILRKSKTDQESVGRTVKIPRTRGRLCAVSALERWWAVRGKEQGALFKSVNRHGAFRSPRITSHGVAWIVKCRVQQIGLDPREYSGHSLRAGFVTAAARAGAAAWQIKQQTGHKSDAVLARYIRDTSNAGEDVARLIVTSHERREAKARF